LQVQNSKRSKRWKTEATEKNSIEAKNLEEEENLSNPTGELRRNPSTRASGTIPVIEKEGSKRENQDFPIKGEKKFSTLELAIKLATGTAKEKTMEKNPTSPEKGRNVLLVTTEDQNSGKIPDSIRKKM